MATSTNPTPTKIVPSADRNAWLWGFTPQAEIWNGRFAMIGFVAALLTEFLSGEGVLHFYNLLDKTTSTMP
jgi:Chlorophyll A-B binding protein